MDETLRSNYNNSTLNHTVPVIDLNDQNASNLIGHACRTRGVYQVLNHGVPITLLHDIQHLGETLFSLPSHHKHIAAHSPDGVDGYGLARISSFFPKLMWSEGFTIVGSPLEHFRQLWPQYYHCGETDVADVGISGYHKGRPEMGRCKRSIQKDLCCLATEFVPNVSGSGSGNGSAAHTDPTFLTILYQNNISRLQVHRKGSVWVTVPPVNGGLMVNVEDLMQILSNGLYRSVLHGS
ncbi:hypothetical protein V8G54_021115 [Vigna mungo]|uniref:Fe2OG dioxygenase domain-containing protein n=1 Tax=Vigna mungo TaxID=3915 RepID=A0AAQ3NCZ3_VIGMU